jgi:16S rRNA (cytidine1402-2'-O)-methyltransferase
MFLGYPPEKQAHRITLLEKLREIHATLNLTYVFYVSPHKLGSMLIDMEQSLGDCEIVLGRELTKVHEELWRGPVSQAKTIFQNPKGELVLLFRL